MGTSKPPNLLAVPVMGNGAKPSFLLRNWELPKKLTLQLAFVFFAIIVTLILATEYIAIHSFVLHTVVCIVD